MDGQATVEIERPRSAGDLIGTAFELYLMYPWLFFALAAVVVVPWELLQFLNIALLHGVALGLVGLFLSVGDIALVLPLVSAFHVHAVDDLRQGRRPAIGPVSRRGIETLPTVSAATFVAFLGEMAGLLLLIVPGVILMLRWSVVAQSAAIDDSEGSTGAFENSKRLTHGSYRHVLAVIVLLLLINAAVNVPLIFVFGLHHQTVVSFLVRLPFNILISSFGALAAALLYFDLSARPITGSSPVVRSATKAEDALGAAVPSGHPLDPASWADEDRPSGWYVVPDSPWRMRFWAAEGSEQGWSRRTTKTPKKVLAEWRDLRWRR